MIPAVKLGLGLIAVALVLVLAVVLGMTILGVVPGHERHASMPAHSVAFIERGGHHK